MVLDRPDVGQNFQGSGALPVLQRSPSQSTDSEPYPQGQPSIACCFHCTEETKDVQGECLCPWDLTSWAEIEAIQVAWVRSRTRAQQCERATETAYRVWRLSGFMGWGREKSQSWHPYTTDSTDLNVGRIRIQFENMESERLMREASTIFVNQALGRKVWARKVVSSHQDISGIKPIPACAGPASQQEQAERKDPAKRTRRRQSKKWNETLDRSEFQGA